MDVEEIDRKEIISLVEGPMGSNVYFEHNNVIASEKASLRLSVTEDIVIGSEKEKMS